MYLFVYIALHDAGKPQGVTRDLIVETGVTVSKDGTDSPACAETRGCGSGQVGFPPGLGKAGRRRLDEV
jgi:hypothetical protein